MNYETITFVFSNMTGIKNIIFDLGNVLLNISYEATIKAFEDLGFTNFKEIYSSLKQSNLFDDLETGKINTEQFISAIQNMSNKELTSQQIIDAWNAIILDFPIRNLQILQQLQLHYNIFLLSNTNEIHEACYNKLLMETCGYPTMSVFFDKIYLSHHVGMRKPNIEIYEYVLQDRNLKPSETLFIDDLEANIKGAQKCGLQTIHFTKEMKLEEVFK
jgi:glucose-1-phosphatase